jgi:NAD-dependent DNA ligase
MNKMVATEIEIVEEFCKYIKQKNYSAIGSSLSNSTFKIFQQFITVANALIANSDNELAKQFIHNIMVNKLVRSKINYYSETTDLIIKMTLDDLFKFLHSNPNRFKLYEILNLTNNYKLRELVVKAEDKYRNNVGPDYYTITDDIYDSVKKYAEDKRSMVFENVFELDIPSTLTKKILDIPMGSMDKVKIDNTDTDINNQLQLKLNKIPSDVVTFLIQSKLDGLSGLFKFDSHGKTQVKLFTRGAEGIEGGDISHLIPYIKNIPSGKKLKSILGNDKTIYVKGEIIMKKSVFSKNYPDASNARNTGTGIVNSDPAVSVAKLKKSKDLDFVAFELDENNSDKILENASIQNQKLIKYGFTPVLSKTISKSYINVENLDIELEEFIKKSQYVIDGIIIKAVNSYERLKTGKNPSNAFAFKKDKEGVETTVRSIDWNLSKLGIYNPTVNIVPVYIDGKYTEKATGHNYNYLIDNNIYPGASVKIVYAGSVIPYITGDKLPITEEHRNLIVANIETINYDINGNTVEPYKNFRFKTAKQIEITPIIYTKEFFAKEIFPNKLLSLSKTPGINMKYIGDALAKNISIIFEDDFDLVTEFENINSNCASVLYKFLMWDEQIIDSKSIFGSKNAVATRTNILKFIEKILMAPDESIVTGFNILGGSLSMKTIEKFMTVELGTSESSLYNIFKFSVNDKNEALLRFSRVNGIGAIKAKQFVDNSLLGFDFLTRINSIRKSKQIIKLETVVDNSEKVVFPKIQEIADAGRNFIMTGKREENIVNAIINSNGKIASNVSKKTKIGIYDDQQNAKQKAKKWKDKFKDNIEILTHDEFRKKYMS